MKEGKTCKICLKTFTRRNYLQKHIENIHSKRYTCPTCLRYFAGPTEHSCAVEDGRFACYVDKCSLKFANGMSLRLHVRDGHRQVDENIANAALKTRKSARDMVKMLCKKINVLTKCYDELKYQMDNMTYFLKNMGYETINETPKTSKKETKNEKEFDNVHELFEYIEEEFIEEVTDDDEMNSGSIEELQSESELIEVDDSETITMYPAAATTTTTMDSTEVIVPEIPTITLPKRSYDTPVPIMKIPAVARVGSTIIRQLPYKIVPMTTKRSTPIVLRTFKNENKQKVQASKAAAVSTKDTPPPLFLKIQYDTNTGNQTAAEVEKKDPKITFHFDTRPLDNEDYIVPTTDPLI